MAVTNQLLLQYVIQAQNQAAAVLAQNAQQLSAITTALKGVNQSSDATAKATQGMQSSFLGNITAGTALGNMVSNLTTKLASGLVGTIDSAIQKSIQFQNAFLGLGSIAKATGNSMEDATAAAEALASDGLMSVNEAAASLKNLLAKGMNLSQATQLINGLRDSAAFGKQGFLEFGQAVAGATEGIKNGLSAMSDNAGVTKNLSNIYKEAGLGVSDIGAKFKTTAEAQKFLNTFLKETNNNMGDAAKLAQTYSGQMAKLTTQMNMNLAELGNIITKNKEVQKVIGLVGSALQASLAFWKSHAQVIGDFISKVLNVFLDTYAKVVALFSGDGLKGIAASTAQFQALAIAFASNIWDRVSTLFEKIASDLSDLWQVAQQAGDAVSKAAASLAPDVWEYYSTLIETIVTMFETTYSVVSDLVKIIWELVEPLAAPVWDAFVAILRAVWNGMDALFTIAQVGWQTIAKLVKATRESETAMDALKFIMTPVRVVLEVVLETITALAKAFSWLAKEVKGFFSTFLDQTDKLPDSPFKKLNDGVSLTAKSAEQATKEMGALGETVKKVAAPTKEVDKDLEKFNKSLKELHDNWKQGLAAGLTLKQMMERFGSTYEKLDDDAKFFNKTLSEQDKLNVALADSWKKLTKEQIESIENAPLFQAALKDNSKWTKELVQTIKDMVDSKAMQDVADDISGVKDLTKAWGEGLKDLTAALRAGTVVNATWMESNKASLDQLVQNQKAGKVYNAEITALIAQYKEWANSQAKVEVGLRRQEQILTQLVKVTELYADAMQAGRDAVEQIFQLSLSPLQRQIRQIQVEARKSMDDANKAIGQLIVQYENLRVAQGQLTEQQIRDRDLALQAYNDVKRAAKLAADQQILQALNATDAQLREYARLVAGILTGVAGAQAAYDAFLKNLVEKLGKTAAKTEANADAAKKWAEQLSLVDTIAGGIVSIFDQLGISGQGVTGVIANMAKAWSSASGAAKSFADARQQKGLQAAQSYAEGGIQAAQSIISATGGRSRAKNALGGAAAGAKAGSSFGLAGMAIGAGIGALVGVMRGGQMRKATKEVAEKFGVEISEEMSKAITETAKTLEGGTKDQKRQRAELLNLSEILQEAGGVTAKNMEQTAKNAQGLFAEVAKGGKNGAKATEELNGIWDQMAASMEKDFNGIITPGMQDFIANAKKTGTEVEAITGFLTEMTAKFTSGFNAVASNFADPMVRNKQVVEETSAAVADLTAKQVELSQQMAEEDDPVALQKMQAEMAALNKEIAEATRLHDKYDEALTRQLQHGQEGFDRMGRFASASFQQAIANGSSFFEAIAAITPALDSLVEAQKAFGFASSEAFDQLLKFKQFVTDNEELAGSIQGLQDMMKGFANSGALTQELFTDFGTEARSQFEQMIEGGAGADMSLQAMQPTLQMLFEMQERFGYTVDETTQALLDEAEAAGVVGDAHKNANERMVDGINKMVEHIDLLLVKMGIDIPVEAQKMAKGLEDAAKTGDKSADKTTEGVDGTAKAINTVNDGLSESERAFSKWANTAEEEARRVKEAIDAVSFGSSPGGIKEIALQLKIANDASRQFEKIFTNNMESAKDSIPMDGPVIATSGSAKNAPVVQTDPTPLRNEAIDHARQADELGVFAGDSGLTLHFNVSVMNADGLKAAVEQDIVPLLTETVRSNRRQSRSNLRAALGVK